MAKYWLERNAERLIFLTTIIFNLGESWCNVIVFSILCTHELISTESERNPLTRISLINGSIRARKHVHIPVNSACAETRLACEQVLNLGESREFPREPHAKGDARARGGEQFLHFSFWANLRTVQNGKHNERGRFSIVICFPGDPFSGYWNYSLHRERQKVNRFIFSKTTTLHEHHAFLYIFDYFLTVVARLRYGRF